MASLSKVPSLMIAIYYAIVDIKQAQFMPNIIGRISENIFYLQAIVCVFAPAISADWLSSEANKLKLMLHDRLVEENGKYGL